MLLRGKELRKAVDYNDSVSYSSRDWKLYQKSVGVSADGDPGPETARGVFAWQYVRADSMGLAADGKVGPATRRQLRRYYDDQKPGPVDRSRDVYLRKDLFGQGPLHPVPMLRTMWGYGHAEEPGDPWPYGESAAQWIHALAYRPRWGAGAVGLVCGFNPSKDTVSRMPWGAVGLDDGSYGVAHYWSQSSPKMFARICKRAPELAAYGWGAARAQAMREPEWLLKHHPPSRGHMPYPKSMHWLLAGWWLIARHPVAIRLQCAGWWAEYVGRGRRTAERMGWKDALSSPDGGQILAATTRMANSGKGAKRLKPFIHRGDRPLDTLRRFFLAPKDERGYGKKKSRWRNVTTWAHFKGPVPAYIVNARSTEDWLVVAHNDLDLSAPATIGGKLVTWPDGLAA